MAKIDEIYHDLLNEILTTGVDKSDRTGTGTKSIFDYRIKYNMKNGFPLLTTKKMATKQIITELLWFLSGDTQLRTLVNQGNNIWVGDAYQKYKNIASKLTEPDYYYHVEDVNENRTRILTKEEFIGRIINDDKFNQQFGDLGSIYGKQWTDWGGRKTDGFIEFEANNYNTNIKGINQIQNVINTLKTNPNSRRILVTAWNPAEIGGNTILPPCHWAFEFYTEELTFDERCEIQLSRLGNTYSPEKDIFTNSLVDDAKELKMNENNIPKRRLSLKWHQRSVDSGLGLGFNIASYAFLLEIFAQQVNMVPGMLVGDLTNVHIYNDHIEQLKEQLTRDVTRYRAPTLKLNKAEDIFSYKLEDFTIEDYESYPTVKMPLSN